MASKEKTQQPEFFVKIDDSLNLRRNLLGTSKDVIVGLREYENFRNIRVEKVEYIAKLSTIIDDLKLLLSRLQNSMPTASVREEEKKESEKKHILMNTRHPKGAAKPAKKKARR